MRVAVIVNPASGRRAHRAAAGHARAELARSFLRARGLEGDVVLTANPGHAVELARRFVGERVDRLIAWGGDGTLNEIAGPLVGARTVLGIVRGGSGDGLARGLGVPAAPDAALAVAVDADITQVDVGWLGRRHFLNAAGVGFDAAVADAFSRRRRRGFFGYFAAGFGAVASYQSAVYSVDLDGASSVGPRFMVALANGPQYGNGFVLAPDADPADGYLDAVVVDDASVLRQFWRARRLLVAPGAVEAGIHRARIRRGRIAAPTRMMAHVDGEPFVASEPLDVSVSQGALRMALGPRAAGG